METTNMKRTRLPFNGLVGLYVLTLCSLANASPRITPYNTNKQMWITNADYRIEYTKGYDRLAELNLLVNLYKVNPKTPKADAAAMLADYRKALGPPDRNANPIETFTKGATIAEELVKKGSRLAKFAKKVRLVGDAIEIGEDLYDIYKNRNMAVESMEARYKNFSLQKAKDPILSQAYDMAQKNEVMREVLDLGFADYFGVNSNAKAADIMNSNPALKQAKAVQDMLTKIGKNGQLSADELRRYMKDAFAEVHEAIGESVQAIKDLEARNKTADESLARERQIQEHLEVLNTTFIIASGFANLIGEKKLGRDISIVGGSALNIAKSLADYGTEKFSAALLTGNIASAVFAVLPLLFGDDGQPPPEQIILDEVSALRKDVRQIAEGLHCRFDKLDLKLNVVYRNLSAHLDTIQAEIEKANYEIGSARAVLTNIAIDISNIRNDISKQFRAQKADALLELVERVYSAKPAYKTDVNLDFQMFRDQADALRYWAAERSKQELFAPLYTGQITAEQLRDPDSAFNLLLGILANPSTLGAPVNANITQLSTQNYINVYYWSLAANTFIRLANDWPNHYDRMGSLSADRMLDVGFELRSAQEKLSAEGPLAQVIAEYQLAYDNLINGIELEVKRAKNYSCTDRTTGYGFLHTKQPASIKKLDSLVFLDCTIDDPALRQRDPSKIAIPASGVLPDFMIELAAAGLIRIEPCYVPRPAGVPLLPLIRGMRSVPNGTPGKTFIGYQMPISLPQFIVRAYEPSGQLLQIIYDQTFRLDEFLWTPPQNQSKMTMTEEQFLTAYQDSVAVMKFNDLHKMNLTENLDARVKLRPLVQSGISSLVAKDKLMPLYNQYFSGRQRDCLDSLLKEYRNSADFQLLRKQLDIAAELVKLYVRWSYPRSYETDANLRELLLGAPRLADDSRVQAWLTELHTDLETKQVPYPWDFSTVAQSTLLPRREALRAPSEVLMKVLTRLSTAPKTDPMRERQSRLELTLVRLCALRNFHGPTARCHALMHL